jgi:uncharacterized protein (DUF58 family)
LWLIPAALLLTGFAVEAFLAARMHPKATVEMPRRLYLGRPAPAVFLFDNTGYPRSLLEYVPMLPPGFRRVPGTRTVALPQDEVARDAYELVPERLGAHTWPLLPARLRGLLGLAWWSRRIEIGIRVSVSPDLLGAQAQRAAGEARGSAVSVATGSGAELKQLRDYQPGDPLHRIDWKATARRGQPVTRELVEDQHLEIVLALDVGRASRLRAGTLDRAGLFANIAARFAQHAVAQDDVVGLLTFADRPLAVLAPGRGTTAVTRIRAALEKLTPQQSESSPLAAALRIRTLVRHRSLIVLLTDPGESAPAEELARAVRLLQTRHFVVVAAVISEEAAQLAEAPAHEWLDPYIALAARERQAALRSRVSALRKLGASVIAASPAALEGAVLDEYRRLRRERRV